MNHPDPQQSFTATLYVENKPVVLAHKALRKKMDDPETPENLRDLYKRKLEIGSINNMLTYEEGVAPETFFFQYDDGIYIIKILDSNGEFANTVSMEGELRNWTVYDGDNPTYFRIRKVAGAVEIPEYTSNENRTVALFSGPQLRPVLKYGDAPYIKIFTDQDSRGSDRAAFELRNIILSTSTR